ADRGAARHLDLFLMPGTGGADPSGESLGNITRTLSREALLHRNRNGDKPPPRRRVPCAGRSTERRASPGQGHTRAAVARVSAARVCIARGGWRTGSELLPGGGSG